MTLGMQGGPPGDRVVINSDISHMPLLSPLHSPIVLPDMSSSTSPGGEYSAALTNLSERFLNFQEDLDQEEDESRDNAADREKFIELLKTACDIVRKAHEASCADIMSIITTADELIGQMVQYAYGEHGLFNFLPSFAHSEDAPKISDPESRTMRAGRMDGLLSMFMEIAGVDGSEFLRDFTPKMPPAEPYNTALKPYERSTPLARFKKGVKPPIDDANALAQAVYQARCSIMSTSVNSPIRLSISPNSSCLALAAAGSWKNRSPILSFYMLDSPLDYDEFPEEGYIEVGLSGVAYEIATDDQRKLIYVADTHRIKSYEYGVNGHKSKWIPKHTLGGQNQGPIALINGGSQMLRGGRGVVEVWNIDLLPNHGRDGRNRIGSGNFSIEDSWRDPDDDIELSTGSNPTSTFRLEDSVDPACWHPFPALSPSRFLCAPKKSYSCLSIDLQAGGRTASRFIGHGGHINSFSSSEGDANSFVTSCNDGFVRLFDVRQPLPCISFDAEAQSDGVQSSLLIHVQGIPLVVSGGQRSEQIKVWDPRARAAVYELSTGNNSVNSLAWDGPHSTLYAATSCEYMDRLGYHHGYRPARIREEGRANSDTDDYDEEKWWPKKAYHDEKHFGYALDNGDHCLMRYAFGADADPDIFPAYGNACPSSDMEW